MIEAVNSVLANASLLRGSVEQVDVAHAPVAAAQVSSEGPSGPTAPYVSPYIHVDINFDKAVLQIRDGETGDVVRQFPSESTLEARRRAEIAKLELFTPETKETKDFKSAPQIKTDAAKSAGAAVSKPSSGGNAQAQVAAAALAASARAGQASTGAVSLSA